MKTPHPHFATGVGTWGGDERRWTNVFHHAADRASPALHIPPSDNNHFDEAHQNMVVALHTYERDHHRMEEVHADV